MRQPRSIALVISLVGGAVAVTLGVSPGVSAAQAADRAAGSGASFTVVERARTDATTDTGPRGDSVGDVLTFANPIFDRRNKHRIGSDNGYCIRTKVGVAYECSWTTTVRGGSLVVSGPFLDSGDSVLAITGGTGKYAGARGQMRLHPRNAAASAYDFTFHVR